MSNSVIDMRSQTQRLSTSFASKAIWLETIIYILIRWAGDHTAFQCTDKEGQVCRFDCVSADDDESGGWNFLIWGQYMRAVSEHEAL